jgi:hypothetical protein
MKAEKIEWLKEYHYLHNTLKFKKAEVIGGILKKYRYSPEKYESTTHFSKSTKTKII